MIRLVLAIWAAWLPGFLHAETIRVQTGEHDAFTRVVLTVPPASDWQIGQSETGYDITLSGALGYDLRRFYELIPRDRIADVSQSADGATLSLVVECPCSLESFTYLDRFLVVDIRDGAADATTPVAVRGPTPRAETAAATTDAAPILSFARRPLEIGPDRLIPLLPDSVSSPVASPQAAGIAVSETQAQVPEKQTTIPDPIAGTDVGQVGRQIAESVARALSEGALGPASFPPSPDPLGPFHARHDVPGITARTSRQQLSEDISAARDGARACLDDSLFAIESWADARPFHIQLRELAARAFDEERATADEDVIALARLYLHFGFAEEAIRVIRDDGRQSLETQSLLSIAAVLLDGQAGLTVLDQQQSCTNRAALWAVLAGQGVGAGGRLPATLLVNEYRRLPVEVRAIVGPPLVEVLLAEGDVDSAMQIMGRIPEAAVEPGPAAAAESDLERALARPEGSAAILDDAIEGGRAVTAQVLTRRLQLGAEEGQAVDDGLADLADAVLFERRGTQDADALALAQFRFHLASGGFDRAAMMITDRAISEAGLSTEALKTELAIAAVERMQDMPFGRYAWDAALLPQNKDALDAIADRLVALGFDARAADLREGALTPAAPDEPTDRTERVENATPDARSDSQARQVAATRDSASGTELTALRALILASQDSRARADAALTELAPSASQ